MMFGDVNNLAKAAQKDTLPKVNAALEDASVLLKNINGAVFEARQMFAALKAVATAALAVLAGPKS